MTQKKKPLSHSSNDIVEEVTMPQSKHPLVFVSHDTR